MFISSEVLNVALKQISHNAEKLFAVMKKSLHLNLSSFLICLHRRHCLKAVKQHLDLKDKWWIIDLYLNDLFSMILLILNNNWYHSADIDNDAKMAIKEKYLNSRNFNDDNIFWNLQYHQKNNNKQEINKWMTRLSESKWRDVI